MKRQPDPRMHSVEHILNQTMVRIYDCGRCFAAHIDRKKSKCDYHFDHALTDEEISDIQSRVNNIIDSDLSVKESFTKYLEDILDKNEQLVAVAVKENKVIGFSLAYIETLPEWFESTRIGLIRYLAVPEGAQGKGIGDQIFTFVKDWFSSFGIKRIELYVLNGLQASNFWKKIGFLKFMNRRFLEI
ncbi:MAG: GNAT family N-acetyltransferase [Deltaproteobacteria bacterium]|nr:GNAT family N-acetyltransferase [Deltaproteobacteria bacterium]